MKNIPIPCDQNQIKIYGRLLVIFESFGVVNTIVKLLEQYNQHTLWDESKEKKCLITNTFTDYYLTKVRESPFDEVEHESHTPQQSIGWRL